MTNNKSPKKYKTPGIFYEEKARKEGFKVIAGIDEAGRGPLAGPVVAAAVVLLKTDFTERIDDSKKLSFSKREKAYLDIIKRCEIGVGMVESDEIDEINIYRATCLAMEKAVKDLKINPDYLLIDGKVDVELDQKRAYLINGESKSLSIACASIIAKVTRDRIMLRIDKEYPHYGFSKHKGYGTKYHMEAIKRHGLSLIHRKTFGPFGGKNKLVNKGENYVFNS